MKCAEALRLGPELGLLLPIAPVTAAAQSGQPRTPEDTTVVSRANALTIDPASFPLFADPARNAQSATAYAGGVNWYLNRAVRLQLNYERTRFAAAPGAVARPNENVLISRMQLAF